MDVGAGLTPVSARATLYPNGQGQGLEVGELVSRWVDGCAPCNGFVIEKTAATSGGQPLALSSPNSA